MTISEITSRQILDSRGRPTLETTVGLDVGVSGTAAVPSGASTGSHEALELRDGEGGQYDGLSVAKAMANVTGPIAKALHGQDIRQLRAIDQLLNDLDGTVNKSKLGANAILSVSLAAARAGAALQHLPLYTWLQQVYDFPEVKADHLPQPMMNVFNGGRHADTKLQVQEFLLLPKGETAAEQIERGVRTYWQLAMLLKEKHLRTTLGDEGGYAPAVDEVAVVLDFLTKAITAAGYQPGEDIALGLDLAATEFYQSSRQRYTFGKHKGGLTAEGMIGMISEWLAQWPIATVEDALAEDDWEGWQALTAKLGSKLTLIGDDLFVTNVHRLQRGIESQAANAILIKPNQIGTVSETVDAIVAAQAAHYKVAVSHRSGETNDPFIVDLAVAAGADFLKAGAPARGERVAKYNRFLAIASELGQ